MFKILLWVGLGGFVGSILRYMAGWLAEKNDWAGLPYATFSVNIIGCLMIGLFYGWAQRYEWMNENLSLFLMVGLCGGFTTFSTFSLENLSMLQNHNYSGFALYAFGSVAVGLLAVIGGLKLAAV